ncbi:MAG: hypothetical protein K2X39_02890 [Silvanigrellaceae bacterium]|nr:hypothetical protein [Silvanigrellaceae bacterium]
MRSLFVVILAFNLLQSLSCFARTLPSLPIPPGNDPNTLLNGQDPAGLPTSETIINLPHSGLTTNALLVALEAFVGRDPFTNTYQANPNVRAVMLADNQVTERIINVIVMYFPNLEILDISLPHPQDRASLILNLANNIRRLPNLRCLNIAGNLAGPAITERLTHSLLSCCPRINILNAD